MIEMECLRGKSCPYLFSTCGCGGPCHRIGVILAEQEVEWKSRNKKWQEKPAPEVPHSLLFWSCSLQVFHKGVFRCDGLGRSQASGYLTGLRGHSPLEEGSMPHVRTAVALNHRI